MLESDGINMPRRESILNNVIDAYLLRHDSSIPEVHVAIQAPGDVINRAFYCELQESPSQTLIHRLRNQLQIEFLTSRMAL